MKWDRAEREILEQLDAALRDAAVFPALDTIASRVVRNLHNNPSVTLAWDTVPRRLYKAQLPPEILSSWIFVLRAGAVTGAERHPNSHQRVMSWRGNGDFQIRYSENWSSNYLFSDPDAPLEKRWASIPSNVWHQAVVPDVDWVVVSFHTVPAEELIEERPDESAQGKTIQRLYLDETTKPQRHGLGR